MTNYRVYYVCSDGFESYEEVMAANRLAAIAVFESFDIPDVVDITCIRETKDE